MSFRYTDEQREQAALRIKVLMDAEYGRLDVTQRKTHTETVAAELDITKTYLSLVINNKKIPSRKVIRNAAKHFNVTEEHLIEPPALLEELESLVEGSSDLDVRITIDFLTKQLRSGKSSLSEVFDK